MELMHLWHPGALSDKLACEGMRVYAMRAQAACQRVTKESHQTIAGACYGKFETVIYIWILSKKIFPPQCDIIA